MRRAIELRRRIASGAAAAAATRRSTDGGQLEIASRWLAHLYELLETFAQHALLFGERESALVAPALLLAVDARELKAGPVGQQLLE